MESVQFEALNLLLKAQSKDVVVRLCNEVHLPQNPKHWPEPVVKYASQALSSSNSDSKMVVVESKECMAYVSSRELVVMLSKAENGDFAQYEPRTRCMVKQILTVGEPTEWAYLLSSMTKASMLFMAVFDGTKNYYVLSSVSIEPANDIPGDFHKSLADLLAKILSERLPQWKLHAANNLVFLPQLVDFDWRVDIKTSSDSLSRMSVPTCFLQLQVQEPASEVGIMPPMSCVNVELSRETLDTMLDGLGKIRDQLSSVANK